MIPVSAGITNTMLAYIENYAILVIFLTQRYVNTEYYSISAISCIISDCISCLSL